jgi:predicted negative regulator of RcsB-dependent stress response
MATPLDLQEQEQLDELKAFWKQYGNLITWLLILVLGGFAAFNGWNWWQREQGAKAGAMVDALVQAAEAGDAERTTRVLADLKDRYGRTAQAQQGALLAARVQLDKQQSDAALATLAWVADNAGDDEYRSIARLRAAGILLDKKRYDEALKQLDAAKSPNFAALVADRRGDVLNAQGKAADARAAYDAAYKAMAPTLEYRRLVEAKLTALGAAPAASGVLQ